MVEVRTSEKNRIYEYYFHWPSKTRMQMRVMSIEAESLKEAASEIYSCLPMVDDDWELGPDPVIGIENLELISIDEVDASAQEQALFTRFMKEEAL